MWCLWIIDKNCCHDSSASCTLLSLQPYLKDVHSNLQNEKVFLVAILSIPESASIDELKHIVL